MSNFVWKNGDGNFSDANHWTETSSSGGNTAPGPGDDAQIYGNDLTMAGSLDVSSLTLGGSLTFDQADVTVTSQLTLCTNLTLHDGSLNYTAVNATLVVDGVLNVEGADLNVTGVMSVGHSGAGDLTISGGVSSLAAVAIGDLNGAVGVATIEGASKVATDRLIVGEHGDGTLTLSGGASLAGLSKSEIGDFVIGDYGNGVFTDSADAVLGAQPTIVYWMFIGNQVGSDGTLRFDSDSLSATNLIDVGYLGDGHLIETSGFIIADYLGAGVGEGSEGDITILSHLIIAAPNGEGGYNPNALGVMEIGRSGKAWANFGISSQTLADDIYIASQPGSEVTATQSGLAAGVVLSGAIMTAARNIVVADQGTATLVATNSALSSENMFIGRQTGSNGAVTLKDSTWKTDDCFVGNGTLQLISSTLTSKNAGVGNGSVSLSFASKWYVQDLRIGETGASDVSIDGVFAGLNGAYIESIMVGDNARGALEVAAGCSFQADIVYVGATSEANGAITFDGGFMDVAQGLILGGADGQGALTQYAGTIVAADVAVGSRSGVASQLIVSGAGAVLIADKPISATTGAPGTGILEIGKSGAGSAQFLNGARVVAGRADVGEGTGDLGNLIVNDAKLAVESTITVGDLGAGTMSVLNSSVISSLDAQFGNQNGSSGVVTLNHSSWSSHIFDVGGGFGKGQAQFNISNGAKITVSGKGGEFVIGDNAGSIGQVNVADSTTIVNDNGDIVNSLIVGNSGVGTLSISKGAKMTTQGATLGRQVGSKGTVTLSGASWTAFSIAVGKAGQGILDVASGSALSTQGLEIGGNKSGAMTVTTHSAVTAYDVRIGANGGAGSLTVSGVGTTLVTNGGANEIVVGDAVGAASALTISNSAKVRTGALLLAPTGTVKVASAAVLTVQKSISGNGVIDIEAGGTLKALGTASANSTIDFAGASATLDIGAQGANVHSPHGFAARLNGFVAGDILAYQGALTKASFAHGQLTLSDGASVEAVLGIKGNFAANAFHLGTFSGGFTSIYVTA